MCNSVSGQLVVRIFMLILPVVAMVFGIVTHASTLMQYYSTVAIGSDTTLPAIEYTVYLWKASDGIYSGDPLFITVKVFATIGFASAVVCIAMAIPLLVMQVCFNKVSGELPDTSLAPRYDEAANDEAVLAAAYSCGYTHERGLLITYITFSLLLLIGDMLAFAMFAHDMNYARLSEFHAGFWLLLGGSFLAVTMIFLASVPVLVGHKLERDPTMAPYFLNHDHAVRVLQSKLKQQRHQDEEAEARRQRGAELPQHNPLGGDGNSTPIS